MITIEHPYTKKSRLTKEERELSTKIKQAARYRQGAMTRWYIDQLAEHLMGIERSSVFDNPPGNIHVVPDDGGPSLKNVSERPRIIAPVEIEDDGADAR